MKIMAPKVQAVRKVAFDATTPWGEREVRCLLRSLRRPHALAMEPLVRFLCDVYAIDVPYDAALRFVRETFVDGGLVGKRLFDLIRVCDIEANETLAAAASEMGVSPRQFFRYRHEAIVALVTHANRLGRTHPSPVSPVEELARLLGGTDPRAASRIFEIAAPRSEQVSLERVDAMLGAGSFFGDALLDEFAGIERLRVLAKIARACFLFGNTRSGDAILEAIRASTADSMIEDREVLEFDLLSVSYTRALYREGVRRRAALAREIRRAAKGDELRTIVAVLIEIETAVCSGDLALAEQALTAAEAMILRRKQPRPVIMAICARAAIAFMHDDLPRAHAYIESARLALMDHPLDAIMIEAFSGRIALAMNLPWRARPELLAIADSHVRRILPSQETSPIALDGSTERLFPRLYLKIVDLRAAMGDSTFDGTGEVAETLALVREAGFKNLEAAALALQGETVRAWELAADLGDRFIAHDLFESGFPVREFGPVNLDRSFLSAFYRSLSARFPDACLIAAPDSAMKDAFWRSILNEARAGRSPAGCDEHPYVEFLRERARGDDCQKQRTALIRAVAYDASILLPRIERAGFIANFTMELDSCYARLPGYGIRSKRPHF
jgi:hypothetical protein